MKTFPSLILLISIASLISCSGGNNDLDRSGLKGEIKSIKEVQCEPTRMDDKWVASDRCGGGYRLMNYDSEGSYLETVSMNERGDTLGQSKIRRENGEMVEETNFSRQYMTPKHSRLVPTSRTVMNRESENQINFEVWQGSKLVFEGATYYDSKGRVEKQVQVINNREVMVHHVYEKEMLVENYQVERDGTRSATRLYEYGGVDEHGNWTSRLVYVGNEKISPEVVVIRTYEYY